jgi:phosphoglucosamine mutase
MTARKYFGTDGIRGRAGVDPITPEFMLRWPGYRPRARRRQRNRADRKDTRISGYMLSRRSKPGCRWRRCSPARPDATPAVDLTRAPQGTTGIGYQRVANPYYDNGIKLFSAGESSTMRRARSSRTRLRRPTCARVIGKAAWVDDAANATSRSAGTVPGVDLRGKKIAVDCARATTTSPRSCRRPRRRRDWDRRTPTATTSIRSARPQALQRAYATTPRTSARLDGDGDRVQMVDYTGAVVDGDDLLWILASDRHASAP